MTPPDLDPDALRQTRDVLTLLDDAATTLNHCATALAINNQTCDGRITNYAYGLVNEIRRALDAIAAEKIAAEEAREEAFNSGPFGLGA